MSIVALSLDLDHDGDGLLDEADGCTDLDGDGFGNADYNPEEYRYLYRVMLKGEPLQAVD